MGCRCSWSRRRCRPRSTRVFGRPIETLKAAEIRDESFLAARAPTPTPRDPLGQPRGFAARSLLSLAPLHLDSLPVGWRTLQLLRSRARCSARAKALRGRSRAKTAAGRRHQVGSGRHRPLRARLRRERAQRTTRTTRSKSARRTRSRSRSDTSGAFDPNGPREARGRTRRC